MSDKSAASRRRRKMHDRIVVLLRPDILTRDNYRCVYCGNGAFEHLTIDHKTPITRGGVSSMANCVAACVKCNDTKADMTEAEFLALPRVCELPKEWGRTEPLKGVYRP